MAARRASVRNKIYFSGDRPVKKAIYILSLITVLIAPTVFAQTPAQASNWSDHVEAGVFGEMFRLNNSDTNFAGVGARLGVNIAPVVQLEGEVSYDFAQTFSEGFTNNANGSVTFVNSNLRVLHGLFGPKLETNRGPVRFFITAKGGAVNFRFDPRPAGYGTFASQVDNLRANNVDAVFYPGGGAEAFFGPIGLRLDVGDEIYFNNGAYNNLRITFGPSIRF
jgi:hypothetical protein